jgi:hypothetical protein
LFFGGTILSGYLLGVIGTVIFSAVLTAVIPNGKTSGLIKAVARMACVLAIVAPAVNYLGDGPSFFSHSKKTQTIFSQSVIEEQSDFIQYYSETRIEETQEMLSKDILQKYGLKTDVSLEWLIEDKGIKITRILVDINDNASGEIVKNMSEYLTNNYCSEVLIE